MTTMITLNEKEYRIVQGVGSALDAAFLAVIIGTKAMNPVAKVLLAARLGLALTARIILMKKPLKIHAIQRG